MFSLSKRRAALGAAVTTFAALAFGGPALADVIFDFTPPVTGHKRGYNTITAKHSGLMLNVPEASTANGTQIIQWDGTTFMNGHWEYMNADGANYPSIRNRWSRQCLDVDSTQAGAPVVQRPCDGSLSQQWDFLYGEDSPDPYYQYLTNRWSKLDLNVEGGSKALGAKLIQWPRSKGAPNSLWRIITPFQVTE